MDPTDIARVMGERIRRRVVGHAFAKDALAGDAGQYIVHRAENPIVLRGGYILTSATVAAGGNSAEFSLRREPGAVGLGSQVSTSGGMTAFTAVSLSLAEIELSAGQLIVLQVSKTGGGVLLPTWFFSLEYDLVAPT